MFPALEVVTAIGRHVVHAGPAHRNHGGNKGRKAVGFFEEVAVVVERKRNERKHGFLASLRKEPEQRDRQQEVFPRYLVRRHKSIPGHKEGQQANVEHFRRCRARLEQVYGHATQEGDCSQCQFIAPEPLRQREEKRQQAQQVERVVHLERSIARRFHEVEHERVDEPERLALEVVYFRLAVENAIGPDSLVADATRMLEVHLQSHRFPAGLVAQYTVRIADVPEHEHRENNHQDGEPAKGLTARQELPDMLRDKRNVHHHARNEQHERREDGVVAPVGNNVLPVVRNGALCTDNWFR